MRAAATAAHWPIEGHDSAMQRIVESAIGLTVRTRQQMKLSSYNFFKVKSAGTATITLDATWQCKTFSSRYLKLCLSNHPESSQAIVIIHHRAI